MNRKAHYYPVASLVGIFTAGFIIALATVTALLIY
jgi:hypothetical protein